jgi:hypothetical protein
VDQHALADWYHVVRSFLSRMRRRLAGSAPGGASWRALCERQACLVKYGHTLLVEDRGSYMEEPGDGAGAISGTTGAAHEDMNPAVSLTRSGLTAG